MTYFVLLLLLAILVVQFMWFKQSKTSTTLIFPVLFTVIFIVLLILHLDLGTMTIPAIVTGILLWVLFILTVSMKKK
ncbi:hypothetical protein [Kurthia senegalensis]|uniref:hypothetical protein n=1 Tax=Kurthia senegalensis TaxID=1033740 RepID=UPI0002889292|nr:hypothetical protein [Kurthia senegalensis]